MNIKLSDGAVRVRVVRAELEALISSRAVNLDLELPRNHVFRLNVRPAVIGGWKLESDPTGIWISIPRTELEALSQSLPSRDGLEHFFELASGRKIEVSFEVDIREST